MLLFNANTGVFSYAASRGITLPLGDTNDDLNVRITKLLQNLNLYDNTLKITASYKRKSQPDITYIEIRRDWEQVGLPILNPVGLLNLSEKDTVSDLTYNSKTTDAQSDEDVTKTSDKKDGLARKVDFNTMTIGVSDLNQNVVSIDSNIRRIDTSEPKQAAVISYNEALQKLKSGQHSFILTTPAGSGENISWDKVYPRNTAEADRATVTESLVTYLEQPPSTQQISLEPYYLFKGYSKLKSGYQVDFIAAVSATSNTMSEGKSMPKLFSNVVYAFDDPSQKQATFDLTPGPTYTPWPTPDFSTCIPKTADLNPLFEQNSANPNLRSRVSFGWSAIALIKGQITLSKKGWWYYVPAAGTTDTNLVDDVNQVIIQIRSITGENDFRKFDKIREDFQLTNGACPVRVTGDSPSIFLYAPAGSRFSIKPQVRIGYADPPLSGRNTWETVSNANGNLTANGFNRDYLFYEYTAPESFNRPETGWIVYKEKLADFAKATIASGLQLKTAETDRLLFELNYAASSVKSNYMYIGLIDPAEVEQKLPLSIQPRPGKVYRYHFYVAPSDKDERSEEPVLKPLERAPTVLLEIGSFVEK